MVATLARQTHTLTQCTPHQVPLYPTPYSSGFMKRRTSSSDGADHSPDRRVKQRPEDLSPVRAPSEDDDGGPSQPPSPTAHPGALGCSSHVHCGSCATSMYHPLIRPGERLHGCCGQRKCHVEDVFEQEVIANIVSPQVGLPRCIIVAIRDYAAEHGEAASHS